MFTLPCGYKIATAKGLLRNDLFTAFDFYLVRSLWFSSSILSSLGNCARHLPWLSSLVVGPCSPFGLLVLTGQIHFLFTGPHILLKHRWGGSKQRRFLTCVPPEYTREEGHLTPCWVHGMDIYKKRRMNMGRMHGHLSIQALYSVGRPKKQGNLCLCSGLIQADSWAEGWSMETWPIKKSYHSLQRITIQKTGSRLVDK